MTTHLPLLTNTSLRTARRCMREYELRDTIGVLSLWRHWLIVHTKKTAIARSDQISSEGFHPPKRWDTG